MRELRVDSLCGTTEQYDRQHVGRESAGGHLGARAGPEYEGVSRDGAAVSETDKIV